MGPVATPAGLSRAGVLYGIAAYGSWGLFPIYFKMVAAVPVLEVLAHRVIWSLALLAVLMTLRRGWRTAAVAVRARGTALTLAATALLIACNWLLFIWSITSDQLLQSSLGYFINPLVNVLLGSVFLGERLRGWQWFSVGLAAAGVIYLTLSYGQIPFIALVLAGTFGVYGLLRKIAKVDAMVGLTVETALLMPLALGFLLWRMYRHEAVFGSASLGMDGLLVLAGIITAMPLMWFTAAARRLPLTTLGFLQYLSPTGHFLLAVLAFGEPFTRPHLVAFACIWTALAIYTVDSVLRYRNMPLPSGESPLPE